MKGRDSWPDKRQKRLLNLGKSNVTRSEHLVLEGWGSCTKKDARLTALPKCWYLGKFIWMDRERGGNAERQ